METGVLRQGFRGKNAHCELSWRESEREKGEGDWRKEEKRGKMKLDTQTHAEGEQDAACLNGVWRKKKDSRQECLLGLILQKKIRAICFL